MDNLFTRWITGSLSGIKADDILFFGLQITLIALFIYGIYAQTIKIKLEKKIKRIRKKFRHAIRNNYKKVIGFIRTKSAQLKSRYYKLIGKEQNYVISADSVIMGISSSIADIKVIRGSESWPYSTLAWSIMTIIYSGTTSSYFRLEGSGKVIAILVIDIAMITWLCFYSRWFRNKIFRVINHRNRTPD